MMPEPEKDSLSNTYREVAPYLGLGLQLAATMVVMIFIGDWIDKKYETSPIWTLIFGVLGIFTGMYQLIKTVLNLQSRKSKDEKKL
ncbi:MAG: AtpZ/AtpI family protein [Ignavibacteria bacterium]|nr:AtpZ/AtpI family protein [Ignavibacteria bacterium]MDP3832074.1 AtpZ/AtpI family protein [Ignavibacteriaceae bacterium]